MEIDDKKVLTLKTLWSEYCQYKDDRLILKLKVDKLREELYNLSLKTNDKKQQYEAYSRKLFDLK